MLFFRDLDFRPKMVPFERNSRKLGKLVLLCILEGISVAVFAMVNEGMINYHLISHQQYFSHDVVVPSNVMVK